jgi:hypothetical protein
MTTSPAPGHGLVGRLDLDSAGCSFANDTIRQRLTSPSTRLIVRASTLGDVERQLQRPGALSDTRDPPCWARRDAAKYTFLDLISEVAAGKCAACWRP